MSKTQPSWSNRTAMGSPLVKLNLRPRSRPLTSALWSLTLCFWAIMAPPVFAQASDEGTSSPHARDLSLVDIYLHTVEIGQLMYEKYGHTQIRVHDRRPGGSDITYTWGIFDYNDPNFVLNFYRGIMKYSIGAYRTSQAHRIYHSAGKTVWEDRINFTDEEKRRFLKEVARQMRPENRVYDYLYFFDNCSTRPRDLIDLALQGRLSIAYKGEPSPYSFRHIVRNFQATTYMSSLALDVTMNGRLDRKMTMWEEMFLPKSLRKYLGALDVHPSLSDQHTTMLDLEETYYESPMPKANFLRDDLSFVAVLGIPLLVALWLLGCLGFSERSSDQLRSGQKLFGALLSLVSLISGCLGTLMLVSWFFSDHLDLHHNANLMIFWPTDFLMLGAAAALIKARLSFHETIIARPWLIHYATAHLAALFVLALLQPTPWLVQDSSRVLLSFGLIWATIYGLIVIVPKQTEVSRHVTNTPAAE